jgi:hypothetical protein
MYCVQLILGSVKSQQGSAFSDKGGETVPPFILRSSRGENDMIGISTIQFALRLWLAIGMGAIVGLEDNGGSAWREPVPMHWWLPEPQLL